ncbi:MAG: zinc metallopeptidase [Candidatus Margulisiibacteriota bacterium]|nr:zinc metallopeptidase [Candidatus Margulisiibacteriota bacterium]
MFFYDPTFLLVIPALLLALFAQSRVQSTYKKYSRVPGSRGYTGAQLARYILDDQRMTNVKIEAIPGSLSDHYDPRSKTLRLSNEIYNSNSVAALGIAAHEVGHAIQDAKAYFPLKIRSSIVPVANFGSWLAFPLFFIGLISEIPQLMDLGILFFTVAVGFSLITLPVEFNASSRAITILQNGRYLMDKEIPMARKVLSAAALTYVAATAMAILNLVRLLILRGRR